MNRRESREENNYFVLFTQNLTIQKVTSAMLRILIPVKRPRIPGFDMQWKEGIFYECGLCLRRKAMSPCTQESQDQSS